MTESERTNCYFIQKTEEKYIDRVLFEFIFPSINKKQFLTKIKQKRNDFHGYHFFDLNFSQIGISNHRLKYNSKIVFHKHS